MNWRNCIILLCLFLGGGVASAQDSIKNRMAIDTSSLDYDALFNELDGLLDSLSAPRNFALLNLGVGTGYYDYESKSSYLLQSYRKLTYAPSLGYYSKTGLGLSVTAMVVNDGRNINPYMFYCTGSYDYLKNNHFITGIAVSHFFTKDSLPFYTSPLQNELYAYFTYKKFWVKPSVAVSYGWGSRSSYEQRAEYITSLRLTLNGFTQIDTKENIHDLNLITSLRHDFYWMDVMGKNDYVRLTPQIVFTSGTQKFGFNQTSNTYAAVPRTGSNYLYSSDNVFLDDKMVFQPLSLTGYIKTEYAVGKFFIQPQLVFDYYFPADQNRFTTAFVMNAGVIF